MKSTGQTVRADLVSKCVKANLNFCGSLKVQETKLKYFERAHARDLANMRSNQEKGVQEIIRRPETE